MLKRIGILLIALNGSSAWAQGLAFDIVKKNVHGLSSIIDKEAKTAVLHGSIPETCVEHLMLESDLKVDHEGWIRFAFIDTTGQAVSCLEKNKVACPGPSCVSFEKLAEDPKTMPRFRNSAALLESELNKARIGFVTRIVPLVTNPALQAGSKLSDMEATIPCAGCHRGPPPKTGLDKDAESLSTLRDHVDPGPKRASRERFRRGDDRDDDGDDVLESERETRRRDRRASRDDDDEADDRRLPRRTAPKWHREDDDEVLNFSRSSRRRTSSSDLFNSIFSNQMAQYQTPNMMGGSMMAAGGGSMATNPYTSMMNPSSPNSSIPNYAAASSNPYAWLNSYPSVNLYGSFNPSMFANSFASPMMTASSGMYQRSAFNSPYGYGLTNLFGR